MSLTLRAAWRPRVAAACLLAAPLLARPVAAVSCQSVGDSIEVGVAGYLPGCRHSGAVGISTRAVLDRVASGFAVTIVSAGSNDGGSPALMDAIRARAGGRMVVILPADHPRTARARATVAAWAASRGVPAVSFAHGPGSFHPASPVALGAAVRAAAGL